MSLVNCNKAIRNNQYVQVNVQKWLNEKEPGLGSKMKAINLLTLLYAIVTFGVITKKNCKYSKCCLKWDSLKILVLSS